MDEIGPSQGRFGNQSFDRESQSLKLFVREFQTIVRAIAAEILDVPQKNRAAPNSVGHELHGFGD